MTPPNKNESATPTPSPLFSNTSDTSLAEGFRDKVAALHSHFDRDNDGYLNHSELRGLQLLTSDQDMNAATYVMACKSIGCDPHKGVSLDGLRLVYAAEGTNIENDYFKIFPERRKKPEENEKETSKKDTTTTKKESKSEEDEILEVGEDGVDISS